MTINFSFKPYPKAPKGTLALLVSNSRQLSEKVGQGVDDHVYGLLTQAIRLSDSFTGKIGETLTVTIPKGRGIDRVILLGSGKESDLSLLEAEAIGAGLCACLRVHKINDAHIVLDEEIYGKINAQLCAAHIAAGMQLGGYSFDKYKNPNAKAHSINISLSTLKPMDAKKAYEAISGLIKATVFTRDLVNEAPNILYPDSYAKRVEKALKPLGVQVKVLDEKAMLKLGMGSLLAVAQGSDKPARLVVLEWNGLKSSSKKGKKKTQQGPLGFVGKGVTFDTGGISIKPSAGMEEMKMDMAGSAAVVGLFMTLAYRKAPVHAVGVIGLVENMPSDRAYRPADIITAMNGKTIEVLNTDAEGRLVLADCMCYLQKVYKPSLIVDLATLTGAIIVALGHEYCGTFVNNEKLWRELEKASSVTGEKLWRMPLDDAFAKQMDGTITDVKNLGNGRDAGSSLGAHFIEKFLDPKVPWAHLDIAGTAWIKAGKPTVPKGASGFGVRLLDQFVKGYEA